MSALLQIYLNQFLIFVFVLTRVSGLVMTAPIFASRGAPARIRALLAVSLALLITPLYWNSPVEYPGNVLNWGVALGREAMLGLAMGLAVLILFAGLQLAGQVMGQMSGMMLADIFDPGFDASIPIFSQLLDFAALAVFFCIGGHRMVLAALLDNFRWAPPGQAFFHDGLLQMLVDMMAQSFAVGIRAGAPVMAALLLSMLILGLISRTLPQLNIIAVGFSLNTMVMLGALALSLGAAVWVFQDQADAALEAMRAALLTG